MVVGMDVLGVRISTLKASVPEEAWPIGERLQKVAYTDVKMRFCNSLFS